MGGGNPAHREVHHYTTLQHTTRPALPLQRGSQQVHHNTQKRPSVHRPLQEPAGPRLPGGAPDPDPASVTLPSKHLMGAVSGIKPCLQASPRLSIRSTTSHGWPPARTAAAWVTIARQHAYNRVRPPHHHRDHDGIRNAAAESRQSGAAGERGPADHLYICVKFTGNLKQSFAFANHSLTINPQSRLSVSLHTLPPPPHCTSLIHTNQP